MRINHDIFQKPNQVELTIEDQPTPSSYAYYIEGQDLGETMPMWQVQTEGYLAGEGQLIGLVSRDSGFLDSPDTEWISGGVNSKGPMAVAMGRHGNFFHWGFAASPTHLTSEAKDVFVNAVHYIARFEGQIPIARKRNGTAVRNYIDEAIRSLTPEGHEKTVARYTDIQKSIRDRKAEIQSRLDAGEDVSERDQQYLSSRDPVIPKRADAAKRWVPEDVFAELQEDPDGLMAWLQENRPYMRPVGWYEFVVDEDLKSLGLGNDDPALLDRLIVQRMTGTHEERAQRLLERYTDEAFSTAEEWAAWLEQNRDRLFFTEAGGFKWLVNTLEVKTTRSASTKTSKTAKTALVQPTPRSPLVSGLNVESLGEGRYALTVEVEILEGWHAYDVVPANSAYVPLQLDLELPEGVTRASDWERPTSNSSPTDPKLSIFEGHMVFRSEVVSKQAATVTCVVKYQVCDAESCRPPEKIEHKVLLN